VVVVVVVVVVVESFTTIDWSDATDCSLLAESTLAIENPVTGANFSAASVTFTRAYVGVTVYVTGGTNTKVSLNAGDGSLSVPLCEVSASLAVLSCNVSYESEGSFEMILSAYNYVSNVTKSRTIDVYEGIVDLVISGNTTVLTPPGSGTWRIEAGPTQLALENIVCVWNMGTNYPVNTANDVALLDSSTPHEITFSLEQQTHENSSVPHLVSYTFVTVQCLLVLLWTF